MSTQNIAPKNLLENNKEFVDYLHSHAREAKIPATCDKSSLSDYWHDDRFFFTETFSSCTGKAVNIDITDIREFFRQAAEAYEG